MENISVALYNKTMTLFDTLAISLKSTPFSEADRIVSFYTAGYGKLRAIVKGANRMSSKLSGASEALTLNHVFLAHGRSLDTVCGYERIESFSELRLNLERLASGSVSADIVRILGREDDPDSPAVFTLLINTLERLNNENISWVETSLEFHLKMLKVAGFLPMLSCCLACTEPLDMDEIPYYPFFIHKGGFVCHSCYPLVRGSHSVNVSTETLKLLISPENVNLYGNALKAHRFLAYYWGHRLECEVKSFDFLCQLIDRTLSPIGGEGRVRVASPSIPMEAGSV